MVEYFSLWGVMFGDMAINKTFINAHSWILQITELFKDNNDLKIKKDLNRMSFTNLEIDCILFLKHFLELRPETVFDLHKKYKISGVDKRDVLEYAKINRMDLKMVKAFLKYKPTTNGRDVIKQFGIKGPEVSNKIKEIEAEKFKELI